MSISPSDVFAGIQFIAGVVYQVKDNREELQRVSNRLQNLMSALEENEQGNIVRSNEYLDALASISYLVERAQRAVRKQLKRSLGDRTFSRNEITTEIRRINEDVDHYMTVHTIKTLDIMQVNSERVLVSLSSNVNEIMVKLAELDLRLNTPQGPEWSPAIMKEAKNNLQKPDHPGMIALQSNFSRMGIENRAKTSLTSTLNSTTRVAAVKSLVKIGRVDILVASLKLVETPKPSKSKGLLKRFSKSASHHSPISTPESRDAIISGVRLNSTPQDIIRAIQLNGFQLPDSLYERPLFVTITEDVTEYDATAPGGLQIAKTVPFIWWWNKYTTYHGDAPATTPGHTMVNLQTNGSTLSASGVQFQFHRTLRVPESDAGSKLPMDLGLFPLVPVANFAHRLPEKIKEKGGFIMPMFQREALWISFHHDGKQGPAIKVSVGSVNAVTGVAKDSPTPPSDEQDYVVAGLQRWLDGVVTDSGSVRQFVAMAHGGNYTVEEQVTGKAEHGGFQIDIFPRRTGMPDGSGFRFFDGQDGKRLTSHPAIPNLDLSLTPEEAHLPICGKIGLVSSPSYSPYISPVNSPELSKRILDDPRWNLAAYKRKIDGSGALDSAYFAVQASPIPHISQPYVQSYAPPTSQYPSQASEFSYNSYGYGSQVEYSASPSSHSYPASTASYQVPTQQAPSPMYSSAPPSYAAAPIASSSMPPLQNMIPFSPASPYQSHAQPAVPQPPIFSVSPLGIAPGGSIQQKIYEDPSSPRTYDEENGHRFHVHILTPEDWEIVTGVVAPITPVTAEMYKSQNIPWYSIADDHMAGYNKTSDVLANLKSVAQLDAAKHGTMPDLIDPDRPPSCPSHPSSMAACVFRPCSHVACNTCLGTAMMQRSHCPKCSSKIARIVGMKEPIAQMDEEDTTDSSKDEMAWQVAEMEDMARQATRSGNISIIHLEGDRVAPLHRPLPKLDYNRYY